MEQHQQDQHQQQQQHAPTKRQLSTFQNCRSFSSKVTAAGVAPKLRWVPHYAAGLEYNWCSREWSKIAGERVVC
jgi:hypothetical protein